MSVKFSGDPPRAGDAPMMQAENIHWLRRSRLRSGGRGDRLMTGLIVLTAAVLAAAAGVAALSRHGDPVDPQMVVSDKAAERAPASRAPASRAPTEPPPPAPVVRAVTPAPAPTQPLEARAEAVAPPAPVAEPAAPLPAAREATTVRITPDGQPIEPAPQTLASAPAPAPLPEEAPPAPPGPVFEPVPPIPASSAPPAPAPIRAPSAGGIEIIAPAPPPAARSAPPAPERVVAASNPAPSAASGGRVAIYLDEYPDQKAAAAGLSQKSGAYGKLIGSAGKLTYTRRNGNSWRLRVTNLDQAAAEALCAKLKGAGAPCSVGPN